MNFLTHEQEPGINTHHTSRQGSIQATLGQLIKAFGMPELGKSGLTDYFYHWSLQFSDGTVATIYDRYQLVPSASDETITWMIGGHVSAADSAVHEAFREAIGMGYRRAA